MLILTYERTIERLLETSMPPTLVGRFQNGHFYTTQKCLFKTAAGRRVSLFMQALRSSQKKILK